MSEQNKDCVSYTLFTVLSKASCSLTYYLASFVTHTTGHDLELCYLLLCLFFNVCFINFPRAGVLFMLSTDNPCDDVDSTQGMALPNFPAEFILELSAMNTN